MGHQQRQMSNTPQKANMNKHKLLKKHKNKRKQLHKTQTEAEVNDDLKTFFFNLKSPPPSPPQEYFSDLNKA